MNNIQLNIVANAQFQQVYTEVAKLKGAMQSLQKSAVGGPFTPGNVASIKQAQQAFDQAVLSTRAFTIEHVAMSDSVSKFGKQLSAGQLSLQNYYKIWRDSAKGTSAELDALATSQARLNRSIAIADPLRPGYAKLVTDINGVVTAQEKQIFYQKALNTALQQGSVKLIDFGKNTQWMGRQLTVGLTMPLAMFGAGVSQLFLTVDKELTRMQKVYGTGLIQPTQAALKQIRADVTALGTELARTLGVSVQETASMSADLAATGLEGAKLIGATREAIRMSVLGELDHQKAMQATISLQNVYKLNTQGLTEAVNFLNAVENQTSTSLQDLVDAIPRVGPVVAQLGGSFKDTAAMMVAMKEAGVPAAQGANAIKSAISSLINPTTTAQKAFKQYNIDLKSIATTTGGNPVMMLKSLAEQMKNLDRLSQAQLIEKMFGKFQYARVQALLDNINKSGSQTATVFKLMGASTADLANLASNELKQQTESASGRFKRMTESIKADFLPIGQGFLNSFTAIGNVLDKVLNAVRTISKLLGPVAGIFGKVFGGGLVGLLVAGPVIMLVGLFANLTGNILRGINSMRMFKQGMDAALPSENKFLAGLHGMRNFYQELDKSQIAARNQMDLMPEAITTNAKAFQILTVEISKLTEQFTALAFAQKEAMVGGAVTGLTLNAGTALETQMRLPGFATGGWVPGSGNYDTQPAMLTPGEFIVNKKAAQENSGLLNSINGGSGALGGIVKSNKFNYGIKIPGMNVDAITSAFGLRNRSNSFGRSYQMKGSIGAKLGTDFNSINASMTVPEGKLSEALAGNIGANPSTYLSSFEAGGSKTSIHSFLDAVHQAGVITQDELKTLLSNFTSDYKNAVGQLNKINDANNPLSSLAKSHITSANNPELSRLYSQFEQSPTAFIPDVLTAEQRAAAGLPPARKRSGGGASGRSGSVNDVLLTRDNGSMIKISKDEFKVKGGGGSSGFAHADSEALRNRVAQATQDGIISQKAFEEGKIKGSNKKKNDSYVLSRDRNSPHVLAKEDGMADANSYSNAATTTIEKQSRSGGLWTKLKGQSFLGRKAAKGLTGTAAEEAIAGSGFGFKGGMGMMMGSMALNAAPSKIAGTDISGAKNIASTALGIGSTVAMIPGLNAFTPEIMGVVAGFSAIKWWMGKVDKDRKVFEQGIRDTFSKLENTPDKFIEKINSQVKATDKSADSYNKMSIYGRVYGDELYKIATNIGNGTLKGQQMTTVLASMTGKAKDSAIEFNALYLAAKNAGDTKMTNLISEVKKVYGETQSAVNAIMLLQQMAAAGVNLSGFDISTLTNKKAYQEFLKSDISNKQTQIELLKKQQTAAGGGAADPQKALKDRIAKEELVKKNLEDQLKAMQDQAKTIQQQNDYLNKQTDLTNQIKQAEVTGNYIQAAQLRNVKQQETAKYAQQNAIDAKQSQIDSQQKVVDALNNQLQSLQNAAASAAQTASNTAEIKALADQIAKEIPLINSKTPGGAVPGAQKNPKDLSGNMTFTDPVTKKTGSMLGDIGIKHSGLIARSIATWATSNGVQVGEYFNAPGKDGKMYSYYLKDENNAILMSYKGAAIPKSAAGKKGLASGGHVYGAGSSTSDSIPAYLSNGEYVIRASSVAKYGKGTFDALNAGHYSGGGIALNPLSIMMGLASQTFGKVGSSFTNNFAEAQGSAPFFRLLTGKKETNWDYLGAASMLAGPELKMVSKLLETGDLSQFAMEKAQTNGLTGSGTTVNLTVNATGVTDPKVITQMAHEGVLNALKVSGAKANKGNMVRH